METREAAVYVVDDDCSPREAIVGLVQAAGFHAVGFASATEFLAYRRPPQPSCLVLDVAMPDVSGLDLQRKLNAANDMLPIIFLSGYADVPMSVSALRSGAVDFLTKPLNADALLAAIHRTLGSARADISGLEGQTVPGIVGRSVPLRAALQHVWAVASTDTTVLIQGETGTGKERVARALHELSKRAGGPFVTVNCAAIPANLLESELLGHERGAFTGALTQRIGRFELAHKGTIFLDEIGELPLDLQPKLLRVLQEREFERLGSARTLRTNARVVAATNRDLKAMMRQGTFREDLYYRLSVFPIQVPPLRQRKEDIAALAEHFLRELAMRLGKRVGPLSALSLERLLAYDWPGNIRELQNVLERAVIFSTGDRTEVPDLVEDDQSESTPPQDFGAEDDAHAAAELGSLEDVSRDHILRVLNETNWVIAGPHGAAAKLQMKRTTLNFRMKKLGIMRRA
jgi:DNA-binding NtrC family response regulator